MLFHSKSVKKQFIIGRIEIIDISNRYGDLFCRKAQMRGGYKMGKMSSLDLTRVGQIGKIRHCEVSGYNI